MIGQGLNQWELSSEVVWARVAVLNIALLAKQKKLAYHWTDKYKTKYKEQKNSPVLMSEISQSRETEQQSKA